MRCKASELECTVMEFKHLGWWIGGVGAGLLVTGLSGLLSDWTQAWFSSALTNAGTTILLAAPVAAYLQGLSSSLTRVADRITDVEADLKEARDEIRSLRDTARDSANSE